MRPKRFLPSWLLAAGLALPAALPCTLAGTLYWDGTSTGPDADGGSGSWGGGGTNWDSSASGGVDAAWTDGSAAVFGGTGGSVNAGTVSASTLIFRSPGYSVSGSITFSGAAGLIDTGANDVILSMNIGATGWVSKTGTGTLRLTGNSGSVLSILEGTVRGSSLGSQILVADGATYDAQTSGGKLSIEGAGVGGLGALVNNGSSLRTIVKLNLTGPATIGGSGAMEIGNNTDLSSAIDLESHTLTKTGTHELRLRKKIGSPGNITVESGTLWLDSPGTNQPGNAAQVMTIRTGSQFRQSTGSYTHPWSAVFEPGTTWRVSDTSRWNGPVTVQGALALNAGSTFTHFGVISGPGSVTKTGNSSWTVNSLSTYTGGTTISAGKLILAAADPTTGAGSLNGPVTLASGTSLEITTAGALGSAPGSRVSPLAAIGATVETKAAGAEVFDLVYLDKGTLRSNAGTPAADAAGHFVFGPTGTLNVLAADTPSLVTGRLDLGTGAAPATLAVGDGSTPADLSIQATITQATPGRGLLKTGPGVVMLEAPALHTGNTVIQDGSFRIGALGSLATSPVTVEAGGKFGTGVPGKTLTPLTAGAGGTLILPARTGSTTTVDGTLHLPDGNVFIAPVLIGDTPPGTYDLATATAITGSGIPVVDFTAAHGPSRATGSVVKNGNKLQLVLTSAGGNLVWNNASAAGAADGIWDGSLANFSLDGNNTAFQALDSVLFDDSVAPGSLKTVTLAGELAPALIMVDNSNGNYTFTGTGSLTGGGSLVKRGTGTLTVGGEQAYPLTGDITVAGGVVNFSAKPVVGDKLTLAGGAFDNATATFASHDFRSGSASAVLTGSGPWRKTTPGTVILTGTNLLTGPGTVEEGTLALEYVSQSAIGTLGSGPVQIAAGAVVDFGRTSLYGIANTFSGEGTVEFGGTISSSVFTPFGSFTDNLTVPSPGFEGDFRLVDVLLTPTPAALGSARLVLTGNSYLSLENEVIANPVVFGNTAPAVSNLHLNAATVTGTVDLSASGTSRIGAVSGGGVVSGVIRDSGSPGNLSIEGHYPNYSDFTTSNSLTISGNSTYTGATTITNEGVLQLTGSLGATAVTVTPTGTIGGTGSIGTGGSLTFQQDGRLWVKPAGEVLTVNGDVDLGTRTRVVVDFSNTPPRGPFPVLEYTGTLTGGAAELAVDASSPVRQSVFAIEPGLITLDIGSKSLVWKGQSHTNWQTGTAANWNTDGTGETDIYHDGDSVTFDDTGVSKSVTGANTGFLRPAATVFNNSANDYSVNVRIGGEGSITKRGTARVSFYRPLSHSGGSFIEEGSVHVSSSSSLGSGPVNVAAGATLIGLRTAPGGFTCAGTLDPGAVGAANFGSLTAGPTVFSGIYQCQMNTSTSDTFTVNGDLDLTGSTLAITRNENIANPVQSYTVLTYTGNLTGTFANVTGMPEEYKLVHDVAGKRFVVTRKSFSDWISLFGDPADPSPGGDPDGDGFPTLAEWVLGGDPGTSDTSIMPTCDLTTSYFNFRYKRRDSSIFDTNQIVQWSTDMTTWNDIPVGINGGNPVYVTRNGDLPDDVRVQISRPAGQKVFARLKVTPK